MSDELKPCPFCRGDAFVNREGLKVWVECRECGCETSTYFTADEAIAAWNNRAEEPAECDYIDGKCSRCGKDLPEPGYTGYEYEGNYCPTCGAKVRKPEPQVIKNTENYNLADDSKPQIIATGEKHKSADKPDSREQLEDDALDLASRIWHRGCYYGEGNCDIKSAAWDENDVIAMLERQAAITERECMERATSERVGWDCAECAEGLRKRVDELTADAKRWADAANGQRLVAMEQADKVCELTAERDRLQRVVKVQADSFQKLERENRELQDACGELERTVKNLRGME